MKQEFQEWIGGKFMETLRDMVDEALEREWDELEDVPFSEDKKGMLRLDANWHEFPKGTPQETVWAWFDRHHSKGINYLLNERCVE